MTLTTVLRGFKIPISVLDRFLESNGVEPTYGIPPRYYRVLIGPNPNIPMVDPCIAFIRSKLTSFSPEAATSIHNQNAHVFIPQLRGGSDAAHAYVAYAYVMVYAQRQLDLERELPEQSPPGWRELREEMMGLVAAEDEGFMKAPGVQASVEGQDPTAGLFVVLTADRGYPDKAYSFRESDRRCDMCGADLEQWFKLQQHKREVHGLTTNASAMPEDL